MVGIWFGVRLLQILLDGSFLRARKREFENSNGDQYSIFKETFVLQGKSLISTCRLLSSGLLFVVVTGVEFGCRGVPVAKCHKRLRQCRNHAWQVLPPKLYFI
jgi:hypothetical protein